MIQGSRANAIKQSATWKATQAFGSFSFSSAVLSFFYYCFAFCFVLFFFFEMEFFSETINLT